MEGGDGFFAEAAGKELAALGGEAEGGTENGFGGAGAEADDDFGLDLGEFRFDPGAAGGDFAETRSAMDAALAALFEGEMFYGVGDVDFGAVEADFVEGFV